MPFPTFVMNHHIKFGWSKKISINVTQDAYDLEHFLKYSYKQDKKWRMNVSMKSRIFVYKQRY